jgi:hypothetical protein
LPLTSSGREIQTQSLNNFNKVEGTKVIFEYAPLKRQMYELEGLAQCEVSEIGKLEKGNAVWNLFWLSTPTIDSVPGSGLLWWKQYEPIPNAAMVITADVLGEEVLYRKLLMHPHAFMDWFSREDLSIYDSYSALGGDAWREVVLNRASTAVDRLRVSAETVLSRNSNVIHANFGRKRA